MAQVTITVPTALVQRHLDAFAARFGYSPATNGTKAQFFCRVIEDLLESTTISYEASNAGEAARATQKATSESQLRGTVSAVIV